ncbi:MAG: 16S rRNA (cytosine(1402)-N(4))-methyltransferase RsmH [Candidatus Shapirobacteria bacterium]
MKNYHVPVLLKEVIESLQVEAGEKYIDATLGGGGHSEAILQLNGRILGIDQDPEAIKAAGKRFSSACPKAFWQLARGNFRRLCEIALAHDFGEVSGIVFDLGVSSHQLETARRGFSFKLEGPLDMRMDPELKVTAADLVNGLNKGELDELFKKLGGEQYSRLIAEAVCRARLKEAFRSVNQLVDLIVRVRPRRGGFDRVHPATRCFQALRIAVNDELKSLKEALPQAAELLKKGGRLAVISFHSGEDKIVKDFLKNNPELLSLMKKPFRPGCAETEVNPRSRSACLRVGEKR